MTAELEPGGYYDRYWSTEGWETRPPLKLLELFARHVEPTDECLDVGCGDGGTSGAWLSAHAAGYQGVDVSDAAVRMAQARGLTARRIDDAADLPLADDSIDLAVCIEVLEHLFAPQRALAEIHRVLRPGGRLIVTVPNVSHWRNRLDLAVFGRWNPRGDSLSAAEPWRDAHLRFFTLRSLTRVTELAGFRTLERGGYSEHTFAHHVPGVRRFARAAPASPASRVLSGLAPGLLAGSLYTVVAAV